MKKLLAPAALFALLSIVTTGCAVPAEAEETTAAEAPLATVVANGPSAVADRSFQLLALSSDVARSSIDYRLRTPTGSVRVLRVTAKHLKDHAELAISLSDADGRIVDGADPVDALAFQLPLADDPRFGLAANGIVLTKPVDLPATVKEVPQAYNCEPGVGDDPNCTRACHNYIDGSGCTWTGFTDTCTGSPTRTMLVQYDSWNPFSACQGDTLSIVGGKATYTDNWF